MTMRFKSIFLDPYTSQPTYNDKNEVLCEVFVEDGSSALAFVPAETIKSIGIILPERISNETFTIVQEEQCDDKSLSPEIEIVKPFAAENTDFIWSPYRSTPQDHKATKRFIEIVTTEPYAKKLRDKTTPKYKIWQQISNEMKNSGYLVANNEKEGGKKCDQKWRNLENKYALFNANVKKHGRPTKKKPPYYDIMYAIKNKKSKLSATSVNEKHNKRTSKANQQKYETVFSNEQCNNTPCESITTSNSGEARLSPAQILQRITAHHKEILEMQNRHFEEMKANMEKQNDQRQEMLNMFATLVENTKKRRKRSESN